MSAPVDAGSGTPALAVFDRALRRAASGRRAVLTLHDDLGGEHRVDAGRWCRPHLPGDAGLLARCDGPTLDVGCGPGRLTGALHRGGRAALGIDVSAAAVRLARRNGAVAERWDVFRPLPGSWQHVLLADGNIGIGGDPAALLSRCRDLTADGGRVHVELATPGTRSWAGTASLGEGRAPLRWAVLSVDDLARVAAAAALRTLGIWEEAGRWFATLQRS